MGKVNFRCINCNKEFFRYKVKHRPQIFCSRECYLHSDYHGKNVSKQLMGMNGSKNRAWKGNDISYKGLHRWIEINYGVAKLYVCALCGGKKGSLRMNWANLDGKYSRDIKTWAPLCKSCHVYHDLADWGLMTRIWKKRKNK